MPGYQVARISLNITHYTIRHVGYGGGAWCQTSKTENQISLTFFRDDHHEFVHQSELPDQCARQRFLHSSIAVLYQCLY